MKEEKNAISRKDEKGDLVFYCPNEGCGEELSYFSGIEGFPEHLYCRGCIDVAYFPEDGSVIGEIK